MQSLETKIDRMLLDENVVANYRQTIRELRMRYEKMSRLIVEIQPYTDDDMPEDLRREINTAIGIDGART